MLKVYFHHDRIYNRIIDNHKYTKIFSQKTNVLLIIFIFVK